MAPPMIVDLHSHYPMHVLDPGAGDFHGLMTRICSGPFRRRLEATILWLANWKGNYRRRDKPAVTAESLTGSRVRVVLSMLMVPWCEIDVDRHFNDPPEAGYFDELQQLIKDVEAEVSAQANLGHPIAIAHDMAAVDEALGQDKVALIHAVEGGLYLGTTQPQVVANVERLAGPGIGVAYITLAHLFFRGIATNSPALPFLSDPWYERLFTQRDIGLTDLGAAAVAAMMENRIIVDLTHMSGLAIEETLDLMDLVDPGRTVPVIAGHCGCRVLMDGTYNVSDANIRRIAERDGVVGLIACRHWMQRGELEPRGFEDTMNLICEHIDHVFDAVGDYDHVAFGSDQDGFIKPALPGLEGPGGFTDVHAGLVVRYGEPVANRICSKNAMRVLRKGWR